MTYGYPPKTKPPVPVPTTLSALQEKLDARYHTQAAALAVIAQAIIDQAIPQGGTINWNSPNPLVNIYPSGAGAGMHFASQTGFNGPYLVGVGVDHAGAVGIEMSVKAAGTGISLAQWGPGGTGIVSSNRSANPIMASDLYTGLGSGIQIALKSGAYFNDGVITAGSTQLTSATAGFTSADNGKTIASAWPYPNDLQAGTTATYVNSTTITLSKPALATRTGATFSVSGRLNADNQRMISLYDTDSTTPIFQVRRTYAVLSVPLQGKDAATSAFRIQAIAGQTADLQSWRDSNTNIQTRINKDGYVMTRKTSAPADADLQNGEMTVWFDPTPGTGGFRVKGKATDGSIITKTL